MSRRKLLNPALLPTQAAMQVPRAYFPLFWTHKPDGTPIRHKVFYSGRGAAKSYSYALALVAQSFEQRHLVLCTRQYQNSIADSVHKTIQWAIEELGLTPWFLIEKQGIRCTLTGSEFIFKGIARNINEIRSMIGITRCWVEEAHSITADGIQILRATILRNAGAQIWYSYNPDQDDDPIHKMFRLEDRHPDDPPPPRQSIVFRTSWRDNPRFPAELEELREYMLLHDTENYDWVFEGETRKNTNATIFRGKYYIETFDEPPPKTQLYHGLDFGFAESPTCLVRCWIRPSVEGKGEDLMIDRECYARHLEIDDMPAAFDRDVPTARDWPIKADNARPETISYLSRQGFQVAPAEKWQGSVEDGITHLKGFRRIVIHERYCPNVARDYRLYQFKVDAKTNDILPIIVEKNDHGPDATRYALDGMIQMRGGVGVWLRLIRPNR